MQSFVQIALIGRIFIKAQAFICLCLSCEKVTIQTMQPNMHEQFNIFSIQQVQREAGMPVLWDAVNQRKKTKLKHTSGLYSDKVLISWHCSSIFLDSLTPKLVYIRTERLISALYNGDKMTPKRG